MRPGALSTWSFTNRIQPLAPASSAPKTIAGTAFTPAGLGLPALCLPLMAWWFDAGPERMWFAIVVGLFLAWTHRANLVRLWHGNESRFERARLLYRLYGRSRY